MHEQFPPAWPCEGPERVLVTTSCRGKQLRATVTTGPTGGTATVILRTEFEPLDPTSGEQLTEMIHGAFGQSLESLRRFIEDKTTWNAS